MHGNIKHTIEEVQEFVKNKNGVCLSTEYKHYNSHLLIQCEKGHIWKITFHNLKNNYWCPTCAGRNGTIEDCQNLAIERNGKFLSTEYKLVKTKYLWQCEKGHQWMATYADIKNGRNLVCRM